MTDRNLAPLMAATHLAERLSDHLKATDKDGLKRLLDAAAEQLEAQLAGPPPQNPIFADAARAELSLIRRIFASLA